MQLETAVALAYDRRAVIADATDVSEGGIALTMESAPPPENAVVSLSFKLPTVSCSLEVNARVVHVMKTDTSPTIFIGLQFVGLDATSRKLLRRYINQRRFLFGDLRAPSSSPTVGQRMTERLRRLRRPSILM